MARAVRLEQCPKCAAQGRDRHGDNLAVYADGGSHCFGCGFHTAPSFILTRRLAEEPVNDYAKTLLPRDFTREIPAAGWTWLLKYGLPYSYWQAHCGFTEKENRLIFTVGSPLAFSVGRSLGVGVSKWKVYGDKTGHVEVVSQELPSPVVLVEDIISAHKVGQVATCIPLFGTNIFDSCITRLKALNRPVVLWLDADQYPHLNKKINRLQSLLELPVTYMKTMKDPKEYNVKEISTFLDVVWDKL